MVKKLLRRVLTREFIFYMIFGLMTTVVDYAVFIGMLDLLGEEMALLGNVFAFVAAVMFSYATNKPFVFQSKSWHWRVVLKEMSAFFGARILTFGIEEFGLFICQHIFSVDEVELAGINGVVIAKLGLSFLVMILNYVISKFVVFGRKAEDNSKK